MNRRAADRFAGPAHERERGAAAVEFALVISLLMVLVMGMIDYAYFFYISHVVTTAAREGARAGATWPDFVDAEVDAESTVQAYLNRGGLQAAAATTNQALAKPVPNGVSGSTSAIEVTVVYPAGSLTGFLPTTFIPANARSVASFRAERPNTGW